MPMGPFCSKLGHEHIHLPVCGKEEREEVQRRDFFLIKSRGISQMVLVVKNLSANAVDVRDTSLIPGLGRSPGGGHGNSLPILAWRIPWTEESGGLQSRVAKSQT